MKLSKQLKYYRELNNETQESLAKKIRVTRQSISKWETGACYPDLQSLVALSHLYGITLDTLIKGGKFFSLPFDVGIRFTRKQLIRHFLLWAIPVIFFSIAFGAAISEGKGKLFFALVLLLPISVFLLLYLIFISGQTQRYRHWQITKDGFKVYSPGFPKRFMRPFVILLKGDDLSLYTLIPFDDISRVEIEFKKFILNPRYSLMPHPGPLFVSYRTEPFTLNIVTKNNHIYYEDMIMDYIRCSANAYFYLPEIKDLLNKKNISLIDPFDFVLHASEGLPIHDYVYAATDPIIKPK